MANSRDIWNSSALDITAKIKKKASYLSLLTIN